MRTRPYFAVFPTSIYTEQEARDLAPEHARWAGEKPIEITGVKREKAGWDEWEVWIVHVACDPISKHPAGKAWPPEVHVRNPHPRRHRGAYEL